jgi:hypothetical protein
MRVRNKRETGLVRGRLFRAARSDFYSLAALSCGSRRLS